MIPESEAAIVAIFVQAILYGIYITTLAFCLRWLFYEDEGWKLRQRFNWALVSVTALIFLFLTANLGTSLLMTIGVVVPVGSLDVNKLNVANGVIENVTILIVDAVLIYRCWTVYANSWRIILVPVILWLGDFVCSVLGIAVMALVDLELTDNPVWNTRLPIIWATFYSCNIATNIYATSAIIYRILRVANDSPFTSHRLYNTCRILAESGVLYTLTSALILVARIIGGNPRFNILSYVADAVNFSMTGITFNLVLIRVRQSWVRSRVSRVDTGFAATKEKTLSALQFHVATSGSQLPSGLDGLEQGVRGTRIDVE